MAVSDARTSTRTAAPTVAYVLALIAGVLMVLNGLLLILAGATLGISIIGGEVVFGAAGIGVGLVVVYSARRLDACPAQHVKWGAVIIVGSAISLALVGGGFLFGFILGLVGGIIAIAWKV
jgi:hypothetical protein